MSIFKETFQDFVFNQLTIREAILTQNSNRLLGAPIVSGLKKEENDFKTNISLPAGAFYTNTTSRQCIIRMSSGVDLKDENDLLEETDLEKNLKAEKLAFRYILEGGIPENENTLRGRRNNQFAYSNGLSSRGSTYGDPFIRSDAGDNFGIVPMPGIIDAEIRTKTAYGSLRDAKVNFTCHNRRQLDILETLYMRPGMPILLEWGWSPYINNQGKRETYFPYIKEWFDQNSSINDINIEIQNRVKNSGGNYDGFIGYVKNFEILSRPDGGYDCTTELAAMGEVLEGLKGKNEGLTINLQDDEEIEVDNLEFYLRALREYCELTVKRVNAFNNANVDMDYSTSYAITPTIKKFLGKIQNNILPLISNEYDPSILFEEVEETSVEVSGGVYNPSKGIPRNIQLDQEISKIESLLDKYLLYKGETLGVKDDEENNDTKSSYHYIKWELLVKILNSLVIDSYQETTKSSTPITEISIKDEVGSMVLLKDGNLFKKDRDFLKYSKFKFKNTDTVQFSRTKKYNNSEVTTSISDLLDMSVDPHKCLLPHQLIPLEIDTTGNENIKKINKKDRYIKDIFINLDYLIETYEKLKKKGDEVNDDFNLFTFLQTIWEKDINNACVGTHDFVLHTEKTRGNVLRIIDLQRGSDNLLLPKNLYKFKLHGNQSIVRDFNYNTSIDSKLSSTVSVAAQSPNSINDLDAVSFAAFNRNIKYRFFKETIEENKDNEKRKSQKYDDDLNAINKQFGFLYDFKIDLLKGGFTDNEGKIDPDNLNVSTAKKYVRNLESKIISLKSRYSETIKDSDPPIRKGYRQRKINATRSSVIPLKFNAQLDGIGGIVIGNVFQIDSSFLPKGYEQEDVAFAVMTENQTITAGQDWTTSFSGQLILLDLDDENYQDIIFKLEAKTANIIGSATLETNDSWYGTELKQISEEQKIIDPAMVDVKIGDLVYLKINEGYPQGSIDKGAKIRTSADVDNAYDDNIIGAFKSGNKGLELGTVIDRIFKDPEDFTDSRTAIEGDLPEALVNEIGLEQREINGELKELVNKNSYKTFTNTGYTPPPLIDGKYVIPIGTFYQIIRTRQVVFYKIEFNESAINSSAAGPFVKEFSSKIKLDDLFTGPNENQGFMRIDVLQASAEYGLTTE